MHRCRLSVTLLMLISSFGIGAAQNRSVIDLRSWNPETQGLQALAGAWDFAWETIQPVNSDWIAEASFSMPGTWNRIIIIGKSIWERNRESVV